MFTVRTTSPDPCKADDNYVRRLQELAREITNGPIDFYRYKNEGQWPLHFACSNDFRHIVNFLLATNQSERYIESTNDEGETALFTSVMRENLEMMELLINEHHADTHCRDIFGHTLLHAACYGTSEATLDYLLTNHPELSINIRDGYGQTPLFTACEFGSPAVVKRLLREKKDSAGVLAVDERGMNTPLSKACISGRADNIWILLDSQPPEIQQEMLCGPSIFQTPLDRCCDTRCPNSAALEAVLEFNPPPYNICVTLERVLSR